MYYRLWMESSIHNCRSNTLKQLDLPPVLTTLSQIGHFPLMCRDYCGINSPKPVLSCSAFWYLVDFPAGPGLITFFPSGRYPFTTQQIWHWPCLLLEVFYRSLTVVCPPLASVATDIHFYTVNKLLRSVYCFRCLLISRTDHSSFEGNPSVSLTLPWSCEVSSGLE